MKWIQHNNDLLNIYMIESYKYSLDLKNIYKYHIVA